MLFLASGLRAETLVSPDGRAVVELSLSDDQPHWSVRHSGTDVITQSPLGLRLKPAFEGGFKTLALTEHTRDTFWKPTWGKFSTIRDQYNALTWTLRERGPLKRELVITVRLYNGGLGLRYRVITSGPVQLEDDNTHFAFPKNFTCWSANYERPNIGPVLLSEYKGSQFPMTVRLADDCFCSILEAAIYDSAYLSPARVGPTTFRSSCPPSTLKTGGATSWRVLLLGQTAGDLLANTVMMNLNPECAIKDASWVKPGLALWDWRQWGASGGDGFVYGLDMPSWKRQIDFASRHGIEYLVLDAGWYGQESSPKSDPMISRTYLLEQKNPDKPHLTPKDPPEDWKDPIDIPKLIQYGKARNVGIILYFNDIARHNYDFEKTLALYEQWGAAGIKYGFMKGKGQDKVLQTRQIVELCAKHHLTCNFHDSPVPPSGDRRTYPNYIGREFCHSQADALRSFTATTFCTTVFCNMLAGPVDMCNGFMTLTGIEEKRPKVFKPIYSTVVAEAARVLIVFSGLAILPDAPESYAGKADLFAFIEKLPMTWDDTRILNSDIGHHITTARRNGKEWFVASCCDEDGRVLTISLDFLDAGKTYAATLYEDTEETHHVNNRESYRIRSVNVKKGDHIKAKLAPGGGHCMWIRP